MSVFDDPRGKLQWLEEELLDEEEEQEEEFVDEEEEEDFLPRIRQGKRMHTAVYADEEALSDRDAVFVERKKQKGTGGLKFLALFEIIGILAVIWWWIKWLY